MVKVDSENHPEIAKSSRRRPLGCPPSLRRGARGSNPSIAEWSVFSWVYHCFFSTCPPGKLKTILFARFLRVFRVFTHFSRGRLTKSSLKRLTWSNDMGLWPDWSPVPGATLNESHSTYPSQCQSGLNAKRQWFLTVGLEIPGGSQQSQKEMTYSSPEFLNTRSTPGSRPWGIQRAPRSQ